MERIRIPRLVDQPPMVLFWSVEELMLIGFSAAIGMYIEQLLICFFLGMLFIKRYRKFNDSQLDGFYMHYCYHAGLFAQGAGRNMPPSSIREFLQ